MGLYGSDMMELYGQSWLMAIKGDRSTAEIFNSDQGLQFTSDDFTGRLNRADIRISWDGKGRAYDNIFVERLGGA